MDPKSSIFSHQRRIVQELKSEFEFVTVVTADSKIGGEIEGVAVKSLGWLEGKVFVNVFHLIQTVIPILLKNRGNLIVFCHMTDVLAFFLAPLCRLLKIPIHLWYAHSSHSFYLRASHLFLTSIMTSTLGSCPIKGRKVKAIGQSIEISDFHLDDNMPKFPPLRWYHVSRLDPSKNLEIIIESIRELRELGHDFTLDIYGGPSSKKTAPYGDKIRMLASLTDYSSWLTIHGPVHRSQLKEVAALHDGFVHAFSGSLDKALLEAIASKRFVVSTNTEYRNEFKVPPVTCDSPVSQIKADIVECLSKGETFMNKEIENKFKLLKQNHAIQNWVTRANKILREVRV